MHLITQNRFGRPPHISQLILYAQAELGSYGIPPAFRDGVYSYSQPPSGHQSRVPQVTQLRTDGVHYRESACTGSVVHKLILVTGAAFSGITPGPFFVRLPFPTPTILYYTIIGTVYYSISYVRYTKVSEDKLQLQYNYSSIVLTLKTRIT